LLQIPPDRTLGEEHVHLLIQSAIVVQDIGSQVHAIYPHSTPSKTAAVSTHSLLLPPDFGFRISWGYSDTSLRVFDEDEKWVETLEGVASEIISSVSVSDGRRIVTGNTDGICTVWKWAGSGPGKDVRLQSLATLRGHESSIISLATSRAFSIIVSGSEVCCFESR
jgi:WD40 repeat protein